jgi:hypothetical protein
VVVAGGVVVLGDGVGLDRLGRGVGKVGSVSEGGLVTGEPSMLEWHAVSKAPAVSRAPSSGRAVTRQGYAAGRAGGL